MKRIIARVVGVVLAAAVLVGSVGLLLLSGNNYDGKSVDKARIEKQMEIRTAEGKIRGKG